MFIGLQSSTDEASLLLLGVCPRIPFPLFPSFRLAAQEERKKGLVFWIIRRGEHQ